MKSGIHTITAEAYHDDPCESPSLSASIAATLCSSSPLHAWAAHPKLNPDFKREDKTTYDVGTVAHAIILQGLDIVEIVAADDWRTKAAQQARDEARAAGRVPLLAKTAGEVHAVVEAIRTQLAEHEADPTPFTNGLPEQTLVWDEDGVMCRARFDWIGGGEQGVIDDLKTTTRSANPFGYSRRLFDQGGDVQAAFYLRGLEAVSGVQGAFRWVLVESTPPYALSVVAPDPAVLTIGQKKVEFAIDLWRKCLAEDSWPGYPTEVCYAELPAYEETRWLEKELREAIA